MAPRAGTPAGCLALLRAGVLLALRFLALPLHARLLVVLAPASLGEDAALLDLLVEAAEGAFERLVLTHSDFGQSRFTSSGFGLVPCDRARQPKRRLAVRPNPCHPADGPPECSRGPRRGQTSDDLPGRPRTTPQRPPKLRLSSLAQ